MSTHCRRPDLDQFLAETQERSASGMCEGGCDSHEGEIRTVRVLNESYDWGWFSYCQAAREEDQRRGFRTLIHEEWASTIGDQA